MQQYPFPTWADHGLLQRDLDIAPEWVIYKYSTFHFVVGELNQILANNLVPNGDDGHLRTFTTLQWECELYNGRPKARCHPFESDGHRFRGKNPPVKV